MRLNGIREALKEFDTAVKRTKGMTIIAKPEAAEEAHIIAPGARIVVASAVSSDHVAEVDWQDTFRQNGATPGLLSRKRRGVLREQEPLVKL